MPIPLTDPDGRPHAGTTFAHELGHVLGLGHEFDNESKGNLMYGLGATGTLLNSEQIRIMRNYQDGKGLVQ